MILTRRIGESLIIGKEGEIKITVLGIQGRQVRYGIDADPSIPVHRQEIFDKIKVEGDNRGGNQ